MKSKYAFILVFTIFVFITLCCSRSDEAQEHLSKWKGSLEYEGGVMIVKNPDEPAFGEIKYALEKDLAIGREDDDNYLFYRVRDIDVDDEGNIYVFEFRNLRVQKFDQDGNYIATIGRQGQGPCEFNSPRLLLVNGRNQDIFVTDFMKIHHFDKDGNCENSIQLERIVLDMFVDKDGNIWAKNSAMREDGIFNLFEKISPQGEILKEITRMPDMTQAKTMGVSGDSVTVVSLSHGYEHGLFVSNVDEESFVYGDSEKYELTKVDKMGEPILKIWVEEPAQPFSGKEKEKMLNRYSKSLRDEVEIPKTKPFFNKILSDDEGRIYIQRVPSPLEEAEICEYDIFSKDGYLLYETRLPYKPFVIRNGCLYTHSLDEESGLEYVVRYRIQNWGEIEKGI